MNKSVSPLRYPGGKTRLSGFIEDIFLLNNLERCTLYEMYAGGSGASLSLLFSGVVSRIVLNDLDFHIYSFWHSVLNETENLIRFIKDSAVNIENWESQKKIYQNYEDYSLLEVGFSTFFLNRCNRSGVLNAGPIGGKNQNGNYKIDVRFNKVDLVERITKIADYRSSIEIANNESYEFLKEVFQIENEPFFVFLDPPYYLQGENLYFNFYEDKNHEDLSNLLRTNRDKNWFLTYDNTDRIKELYKDFRTAYLSMTYTLQEKKKAKEVMVFSDSLSIPKKLRMGNQSNRINLLSA